MNDLLHDRLTDLFDRVAAAVEVDDDLERAIGGAALEHRRAGRRARGWIAAAAAAIVAVAGTVGVMQFVGRDTDNTVAEAPVDPGPLYVLPGDTEAWSAGFGHADSGEMDLLSGVTVGIPIDGGYLDPVAVSLSDTDPIDSSEYKDFVKTTVRLPSGVAYLWTNDRIATLVQRRGNDFLSAATWNGDSDRLSRAIDAVVINSDGSLTVPPESPLAVIDRIDEVGSGVGHTTYMELRGVHDVVVETVSFPWIVGRGPNVGELRPIEVRGSDAWLMVRYDADGTWRGLSFPVGHGTVALSGTVPEDALLALAEDLEVVDEATWNEATGAD
jgi:hypothetical protein